MWRLIAVSGVLTLAANVAPLHSEETPWCVELDVFTRNCSYTRYDECVAVAKNAIGPATGAARCIRNPRYQPPAPEAAKAKPSAAKKQPH